MKKLLLDLNKTFVLCEKKSNSKETDLLNLMYDKQVGKFNYVARVILENGTVYDETFKIYILSKAKDSLIQMPIDEHLLEKTADFIDAGKYICCLDNDIYQSLQQKLGSHKSITVVDKYEKQKVYGELFICSELKLKDLESFNNAETNLFLLKLDQYHKNSSSLELTQVIKYMGIIDNDAKGAAACHIFKFGPNPKVTNTLSGQDLKILKYLDYQDEDLVVGQYYVVCFEKAFYIFNNVINQQLDVYIPNMMPSTTFEFFSYKNNWSKIATFTFIQPLFGYVDDPLPNSELFFNKE